MAKIGIESTAVPGIPNTEPRYRIQCGKSGKDKEKDAPKVI